MSIEYRQHTVAGADQQVETRPALEQLNDFVDRGTAGFIMHSATRNRRYLTDQAFTPTSEDLQQLRTTSESKVDFKGTQKRSKEVISNFWEREKKKYPKKDLSTFGKQLSHLCEINAPKLIKYHHGPDKTNEEKQKQLDAYSIFGIKDLTHEDELKKDLREFAKVYATPNGPDIEKTARTIANACTDTKGVINYALIDRHLNQLSGLLAMFGGDVMLVVKGKIKEYAAYKIPQKDKESLVVAVANAFSKSWINNEEKSEFAKLADYYHKAEAIELRLDQAIIAAKSQVKNPELKDIKIITPELVDQNRKKISEVTNAYVRADNPESYETCSEQLVDPNKLLAKGRIIVDTTEEFAYLLSQFVQDPAERDRLLSHEQAHFDEAKRRGLHPQYSLNLSLRPDGTTYHPHPSVIYPFVPDKETLIAINLAPDDPSEYDLLAAKGTKKTEKKVQEQR